MNLVNEIGNDVARAFLVDRKCGDRIDASHAREIIDAIRQTLMDEKASRTTTVSNTNKLVAKASQ